jgi:hypothetical protein
MIQVNTNTNNPTNAESKKCSPAETIKHFELTPNKLFPLLPSQMCLLLIIPPP